MPEGKLTYEDLFVARFFDFTLGAKTTEFMLLIFTPCYNYIDLTAKEIGKEELVKANSKLPMEAFTGIQLTYNEIHLGKGKPQRWLVDCRENKQGVELDQFVSKAKKDARFLQMWLSKAISSDSESTLAKVPLGLFMQSSLYNGQTNSESVLDESDRKAHELINYYLGLKLIV